MKRIFRVSAVILSIATTGLMAAACGGSPSAAPPTHSVTGIQSGESGNTSLAATNENVTAFGQKIFSQMVGATQEMQNDGERDLTLNKPNRIGYVYVYAQTGQLITFYTIKGKVSSTESGLTESQDVVEDKPCVTQQGYQDNNTNCSDVVDSIGDDGTYGGEEGGPSGVFFFTTSDVLVELGGNTNWFYSDAPLNLTSKPIIDLPVSAKPTSGGVGKAALSG